MPQHPSSNKPISTDDANVSVDSHPSEVPGRKGESLLPAGFRQGVEGTKARVSSISVARSDRDRGSRRRQTDARLARERRTAARKIAERRVEHVGWVALILSVGPAFFAPLAIGGVHLAAIGPIAVVALGGVATAAYWAHIQKRRLEVGITGWALLAMTALTLLKCVPLPTALVAWVAPTTAAVAAQAYLSLGDGAPSLTALSLNPAGTFKVALALLAASAVYVTASTVLSTKERFGRALLIVSVLGLVLVVVGVLQNLVGGERLFFYAPADLPETPLFSSTFVNPNHLAALLGLVSFIPLGLASSKDFEDYKVGLVVLFVVTVAGMVMTLSLPVWVAWFVGMVAFGGLALRRRRATSRALAYGSLAVLFAFAVGLFVVWSQVAELFEFISEHQGLPWASPGAVWAEGWSIATASPLLGTGPGAFGDLLNASANADLVGHYRFVGNHYLQLAIDYGFPAAAGFVIAMGYTAFRVGTRTNWKVKDAPLMAAIFSAAVFVGFEALSSFSMEVPGVLLPAVLLLALGHGRDVRYSTVHREAAGGSLSTESSSWLRRFAPALAVAALAVLALPGLPTAVDAAMNTSENTLKGLAKSPAPNPAAVDEAVRDAVGMNLASSQTQLVAAIAFEHSGRPEQGDVALDVARRFNPANPLAYVLTARRYLKRRQPEAALLQYREGLRFASKTEGPGSAAIAAEIARTFSDPQSLVTAMPDNPDVWGVVLKQLMEAGEFRRTVELADALLKRFPEPDEQVVPLLWAAKAELKLGELDGATRRVQGLIGSPTSPAEAYVILSAIALHRCDSAAAYQAANAGLAAHPGDVPLTFEASEILLEYPDAAGLEAKSDPWIQQMERYVRVLRPAAIRRRELRYRFYMLAGRYKAARGQKPSAIRDIRRAAKANPMSPTPLLLLVELEEEERDSTRLLKLYHELIERFPDHPRSAEFRTEAKRIEDETAELRKRFKIPERTTPPQGPKSISAAPSTDGSGGD